jgi:hypothetical protein
MPARERRQRVLKGATIIVSASKSEISCVVRNQHPYGAELRVFLDTQLPEHFTLYTLRMALRIPQTCDGDMASV